MSFDDKKTVRTSFSWLINKYLALPILVALFGIRKRTENGSDYRLASRSRDQCLLHEHTSPEAKTRFQ